MNWFMLVVCLLVGSSPFLNLSYSLDNPSSSANPQPASQSFSSHVMVFRNTGIVKSAVGCQLITGSQESHSLPNKSILEFPSDQEKLQLTISLEKFTRSYNFNLPPNDTLYLEVYFSNGPGGALPSSRVRPNLKRLPPGQAKALWKEKWARRYFEKEHNSGK